MVRPGHRRDMIHQGRGRGQIVLKFRVIQPIQKIVISNPKATNPTFSPLSGALPPTGKATDVPTSSVEEVYRSKSMHPKKLDRISLGLGKLFGPTKGLCSLFQRTGTRIHTRTSPKPPPQSIPSTPRRSFADVVREGKPMVMQGGGNGGGGGY